MRWTTLACCVSAAATWASPSQLNSSSGRTDPREDCDSALEAMSRPSEVPTSFQKEKIPVIVDTDSGSFSDDFYALGLLLADPSMDVKVVVTSGGDTDVKALVLAKFLTNCGRDDVPIAVGTATQEAPWLVPDAEGLLQQSEERTDGARPNPILRRWARDYDASAYQGGIFGLDNSTAGLARVASVVRETPGATYIVLGSSGTVGSLLDKDAELFRRSGTHMVVMGGSLEHDFEYNFNLDPANTRRMLASANRVTVVPFEASAMAQLRLKPDGAQARGMSPAEVADMEGSYGIFLNGDSKICMALMQLELVLANYGTHVEVASGKTDLLFDSVAAFVASGRHDHLYEISAAEDVTISDTGHIKPVPSYSDSPPQARVRLVTKWVDRASETSFNCFLATALAKGLVPTQL